MRQVLRALLAVITLGGCYSYEGPFHEISGIRPHKGEIDLILARSVERVRAYPMWSDAEEARYDYYVALLQQDQGGKVGPAAFTGADGFEQKSDFLRTADGGWLRIIHQYGRQWTVLSLPPGGTAGRVVARCRTGDVDQLIDALAVARSGRHLLTIDESALVLRSLGDVSIVEESSKHPLLRVRETYVRRLGGAGDWFLTDDLQYIVASPPDWQYFEGVMGTLESTPVRLCDIDLDLAVEGLIFDRETRRFSKFGKGIEISPPTGQRHVLVDAECVDGELLLRYGVCPINHHGMCSSPTSART